MPTEVNKLFAYLAEKGFTLGGVTVAPGASPEDVAKELRESLERIEAGEFEVIYDSSRNPKEGLIGNGYYDNHGFWHKPEPSKERRDLDIAFLSQFQDRAAQLEKERKELVAAFAKEFGEFAQNRLDIYEYDSYINDAVADVMQTAGINEYEYGFWLPSNIGC